MLGGELTSAGPSTRAHEVQGMAFYYPYRNGKETRPTRYTGPRQRIRTGSHVRGGVSQRQSKGDGKAAGNGARGAGRAGASASSSSSSSSSQQRLSLNNHHDDDEEGEEDDLGEEEDDDESDDRSGFVREKEYEERIRGVDFFWTNRHVPQSGAEKLSFFPDDIKTREKCEKEKLPENWRARVKVFLFFDSQFDDISNNKLRFLKVDEDWLNHATVLKSIHYEPKDIKKRHQNYVDSNAGTSFLTWMQLCHNKFDQEFLFEKRDRNLETNGGSAMFTRLTVGGDVRTGGILIDSGETIRMNVQRKTPKQGKPKKELVQYRYRPPCTFIDLLA